MKHVLPTEVVNKVLTYLATKPFSEVSSLIRDIQSNAVEYTQSDEATQIVED